MHRTKALLVRGCVVLVLVGLGVGVVALLLADGRDAPIGTVPTAPAQPGGTAAPLVPGGGAERQREGERRDGRPLRAPALTVTGSVVGDVRLGAPAMMRVTVRNPSDRPVVLTAVTATVTGVRSSAGTGPECTPSMFSVAPYRGAQPLARGGSTTADLRVTLQETGGNQDRCKGAEYRFAFSTTAAPA